MPVLTLSFFSQTDGLARRAAEPTPEMQHRLHPEVARHVQPLQNRISGGVQLIYVGPPSPKNALGQGNIEGTHIASFFVAPSVRF